MKVYLKYLGFIIGWLMVIMLPNDGFGATEQPPKGDLWVTIFIYGVLLIMVVLGLWLMKSAKKLNESAHESKKDGASWISHKLYNFNADQLQILINEVNKLENDNHPKSTEN